MARVRAAIRDWIAAHQIAWELAMAALAVAYVAVGFAGEGAPSPVQPGRGRVALILIFVTESVVRQRASDRRTDI